MSRPPAVSTNPDPPANLDLSPLPKIRGKANAAQWIRDTLGVDMSESSIKTATTRRQIEVARIGGNCFYSELGLYRFVMSKVQRPA